MSFAKLGSAVIDGGLAVLNDEATAIVLCNAEPTTYNEANTTFKIGEKSFGAGNCFGDPEACVSAGGIPGRKVASTPITDGTVSVTGVAQYFAVIDGSRLLLSGLLASPQDVMATQTFTLSSFDVVIEAETMS